MASSIDVDEQALYEGFESAFDDEQRTTFLRRWAALGIPFSLFLLLSTVAMFWSSCRIDRMSGVAQRLSMWCGGSIIVGFWLLQLLRLTIVVAIGLGIAWSAVVIAQIEPVIIGIALLLLTPCAFFLVYAFGYFCGNQWRLTSAEQPDGPGTALSAFRQPPMLALVASAILFIATLLAFVFTGEPQAREQTNSNATANSTSAATTFEYKFSYLSTAWVFLGANVALVCVCVHLLTTRIKHFPIDRLLGGVSKRFNPAGSGSPEAGEADPQQEWFDHNTPAVRAVAAHRLGWIMYGASVAVLAAFALLVIVLAENTATEGAGMGLATLVALLVLDAAIFMAWAGGLFETPGTVCFVVAATRFLLLSAGNYWLLGNCVAYTVLGLYLAYITAQRHFLNIQAQSGFSAGGGTGEEQTEGGSAAATATAPGQDAKAAPMQRAASMGEDEEMDAGLAETNAIVDMLTRPAVLLAIVTAVFTGVVAVMAVLGGSLDALPTPRVPLLGDSTEPQWVFGLGSLAIVGSCLGLFFLLGYMKQSNGRMASVEAMATGALFALGCALLGVMMFLATDSYAVLSSLCFLPGALVLFLGIIGELVHSEFRMFTTGGFGWMPCCCPRGSYCGYALAPGEENASAQTTSAPPTPSTPDGPASGAGTGGAAAAAADAGDSPAPAPASGDKSSSDGDKTTKESGENDGKNDEDQTSMLDTIKTTMGESFDPHKAQCLHGNQLRNTVMFASLAVFVGMLVAFAAVMAQGVKPIRWPWYAAGMILSAACIYVGVREYFATLHLSIQEAVFVGLGLVLHLAVHIPMVQAEGAENVPSGETNYRFLGVLFALFLYPAVWTAGLALYQWKDENWDLPPLMHALCGPPKDPDAEDEDDEDDQDGDTGGLSSGGVVVLSEDKRRLAAARFVYFGLILSQIILLGFSVAGIFVFDSVVVTAAITAGYVFAASTVALLIYIITHRGYLPALLRYGILLAVIVIVLLAIIIGVARYIATSSIQEFAAWISVAWWFIVMLLVVSGTLDALNGGLLSPVDLFEAAEAGTLGTSSVPDPAHLYVSDRELLPMHVPSRDGTRMEAHNWSTLWVLFGCLMAAAWGLGVSFVLSPGYPGLAVAVVALMLALVFGLEVSRVTSDRIDKACAIIDQQAGPAMRRYSKGQSDGGVQTGDVEEGGSSQSAEKSRKQLPGSMALREVVLRAAKKSLGGSTSMLAGRPSAASDGTSPDDISINISDITAGHQKLIGSAAEPIDGKEVHPSIVAGEKFAAINGVLARAYAQIGVAKLAVGCMLGGEETDNASSSDGDDSSGAAAPAAGDAGDDAESGGAAAAAATPAPAPTPAPAAAQEPDLSDKLISEAKVAIKAICDNYTGNDLKNPSAENSADPTSGGAAAAAQTEPGSEAAGPSGTFEETNPMSMNRTVAPTSLGATLADIDIQGMLEGGDWLSAQTIKLSQLVESSSFDGEHPDIVIGALETAADCALELCRRAAAGEDAMRASVASKIISTGVSAASMMRRNWLGMLDWLLLGGEPEAVGCGMQELVAMVRLAGGSRPKNAFEASTQDAVIAALKSPTSLRRYYRAFLGSRHAAEKMVVVRHLQRAYVGSKADGEAVRRARQTQDDEARKRRMEHLKRQRELMEQRRKAREANGKGKGRTTGGGSGGGGAGSDDEVRRARDAAIKKKKEEDEARRKQQEAEEAARQAKDDKERRKLRDAAEKRRREAEAASRRTQQADEARKRAEQARRRRENADAERIQREKSRQAFETKVRKMMQDRSKELQAKLELGEADGGKDAARKKAMQLINQMASEVSDGMWVDGSFDSESGLGMRGSRLQLKRKAVAEQWHDVASEIPNAVLFKGKPGRDTVRVGWLSDSWLAAAMSVLADRPKTVFELFPQHPMSGKGAKGKASDAVQLHAKGISAVLLCLNGEWQPVLVDGLLPVFDPKVGFRKINPAFMRSKARGEMWPSVLEKAYAKAMGSYAALEGGQPHDAMADLTGGQSKRLDLLKMQEEIASGSLWRQMMEVHKKKGYLACGSPTGTDTPVNKAGIPQGFAFAITGVREADDGHGNKVRLVKIRSSAGEVEWRGKYSNGDTQRWTQRLRTLMEFDPSTAADSGEFCMAFDDFVQQYDHLYICRTFTGANWHVARASNAWIKGSTAGGCPSFPETVVSNPQYYLQVSEPCTVHISLKIVNVHAAASQDQEAGIRIGLKLYQKQGKRLSQCFQAEERAATRLFEEGLREVTISAQLQPEGHPLTLLPCTFYPDSEAAFVITVASTAPLQGLGPGNTLKLIPASVGAS